MNAVSLFRSLHALSTVLALPNAWDAASAALAKSAGAKAIATTSAGLAWSCGYADGGPLPHDSLLFALKAICRTAGGLPVSVDLEAGYSNEPAAVAALVTELTALGIAGINLEDGVDPPELLAAKITAIKARADIFINARTDIFLRGLAEGDAAVRACVERGVRYMIAGADGFFVPAVSQNEAIRRISSGVALPLNVLAVAGLPSLTELHALGVRRLSAGSLISKVAYGAAQSATEVFLRDGAAPALFAAGGLEYAAMNALFEEKEFVKESK